MDKKILIDWLTCTVGIECFIRDFCGVEDTPIDDMDCIEMALVGAHYREETMLQEVIRFLRLPSTSAFEPVAAHYGYGKFYAYGGIRVAWGNCDTIMIDMTGEGCRLYETMVPGLDWLDLIQRVLCMQRHNFSRLDVACDTQGKGGLKMRDILRYSLQGRFVSRWKSAPRIVMGREETVDFGCPSSRTMLRIYNKTLERQCKVDKDVEVPDNWVRCEMQLRNAAVDSFVREWCKSGDISHCYLGLMSNQLKFVRQRERNATRSVLVKWWRDFWTVPSPFG